MKNIILLSIVSVLLIFSCKKDEKINQKVENIFGFTSIEKAEEKLGVYASAMAQTNGSVNLRTTLYKHINYEQGEIFARYIENSTANRSDGGEYRVGDISLNFDPIQQKYLHQEGVIDNEEEVNLINPLFGKTNKFSLSRNGELIFETEKYIPEKFSVEFPNGVEVANSSSFIGIKRNELELSWNSDSKNENGIVAIMFWDGSRNDVSPNNQTDTEEVKKAVKLNDTGNGKISKEFFNDIPKNAIITLFTMRGDISIHEIEGKLFRFSMLSEEKSNLVILD